MKNIIYFLAFFILLSCKKQNEETNNATTKIVVSIAKGKQLFETNNCTSCHQIAEKVVGPSLENIAQVYKNKKGDLIAFLKSEAEPIVDPSQYATMKLNLEITKTMSVPELKSLEIYILSNTK